MVTIKVNDLRYDFKRLSEIIQTGEYALIERPNKPNLVLITEGEYKKLIGQTVNQDKGGNSR